MATDKASQSNAPAKDTPGDVCTFFSLFCNFYFLGAQYVLGFLILLSEQYFHSNLRTIFFLLPNVYELL